MSKIIGENKSAILCKETTRNSEKLLDLENNSHLMNFNQTMLQEDTKKETSCHTPKMQKNISEIKLKKVEALTPKGSFNHINNKLKQVWALNNPTPGKGSHFKKGEVSKEAENNRKKRNLTIQYESKDLDI